MVSPLLHAATDAERINQLEQQLMQQRQLLDAMAAELEALKAAASDAGVALRTRWWSPVSRMRREKPRRPWSPPLAPIRANCPQLYGFAMADAIYDFKRVDPNWNDTLRVSTIPTEAGQYGQDGEFVFSVRQSRLGVRVTTVTMSPTCWRRNFSVWVATRARPPPLAPCLGDLQQFGMGQTWSNFMDADIFPNTIDYWGPTGMVFTVTSRPDSPFPWAKMNSP